MVLDEVHNWMLQRSRDSNVPDTAHTGNAVGESPKASTEPGLQRPGHMGGAVIDEPLEELQRSRDSNVPDTSHTTTASGSAPWLQRSRDSNVPDTVKRNHGLACRGHASTEPGLQRPGHGRWSVRARMRPP